LQFTRNPTVLGVGSRIVCQIADGRQKVYRSLRAFFFTLRRIRAFFAETNRCRSCGPREDRGLPITNAL
jgi:hypothetical protein